jgi:mono/diheme cytochrome c family protein
MRIIGRIPINKLKTTLLGVSITAVLVTAIGCSQGSYPLDIFYEMHYQDSYKSYEPPRLSVPSSAVPRYEAPKSTSFPDNGKYLFDVNCSMCHGATGQGDGPVLELMSSNYGYKPVVTPNLTADQVKALGVAGVQGFLVSGLNVMPSFSKLLTEDEMRLTSEYVVNCIQSAQPEGCR